MTAIPVITEEDVSDLVGEGSFQRGQKYFREDRVFDTRRVGMMLKAQCEGSRSNAYHVRAEFDATGVVDIGCSCPIGGHCKHCVALLLTWIARPEIFIEQPDIDTLLQQSSKDELIALIKHMLRREPDLESLLVTTGASNVPVDPQFYRDQVETAFRRAGNDWEDIGYLLDDLQTVEDAAASFVERRDYANAIAVYGAILKGLIDHYNEYRQQDASEDLDEVVIECIDGLRQCLGAIQENTPLRVQILRTLFTINQFDIEEGGIAFGEDAPEIMIQETTAEERQIIADWTRAAITQHKQRKPHIDYHSRWVDGFSFEEEIDYTDHFTLPSFGSFLLDMQEDILDDEAYLRICRETGRVADEIERLLALKRDEEAALETKRVGDYDLLHIADLFLEAGKDATIERIMRQRAWKSRDTRLLDWLHEHFKSPRDCKNAFARAMASFQEQPTFERYREVRQIATQCGHWQKTRPELYAFLKSRHLNDLLTQVAFDEDDTDEIIKMLQTAATPANKDGSVSAAMLVQAAETAQPEVALHFYVRYIAYLISNRNRPAYEQAVLMLIRVRSLYEWLDKQETWTSYIARLRERNRGLKALQNLLTAAEL